MQFKETWDWVLDGTKTQTRRLVKPGDVELVKPLPTDEVSFRGDKMYLYHRADETREITTIERNGRPLWRVGCDYAVQPGRGRHALWWRPGGITASHPSLFTIWDEDCVDTPPANLIGVLGFREARIRILDIRHEDVRNISDEDARAEGFFDKHPFLITWTKMHDKRAWNAGLKQDFSDGDESGRISHLSAWTSWLSQRPERFYDAWVLSFELVKD